MKSGAIHSFDEYAQWESEIFHWVVTVRPTHLPDSDAKGDGVHLI